MCTVTFIPLGSSNFILTSNRDEQKERKTNPPKKYFENNIELLFPKDETAGGTWIGISSKKRLVCVLNGAFEKHIRKDNYKESRGVIAKEILKTVHLLNFLDSINLEGVEPFTMVIVEWENDILNVFEFVWDEHKKHLTKLKNKPKIWSSSTLYSNEIKKVREKLFKNWTSKNNLNLNQILKFHHIETGDKEQTILMKRSYVETVSITSVKKENETIEMHYEDIIQSLNYTTFF